MTCGCIVGFFHGGKLTDFGNFHKFHGFGLKIHGLVKMAINAICVEVKVSPLKYWMVAIREIFPP